MHIRHLLGAIQTPVHWIKLWIACLSIDEPSFLCIYILWVFVCVLKKNNDFRCCCRFQTELSADDYSFVRFIFRWFVWLMRTRLLLLLLLLERKMIDQQMPTNISEFFCFCLVILSLQLTKTQTEKGKKNFSVELCFCFLVAVYFCSVVWVRFFFHWR